MSITYTTARHKKICDYAIKYGKIQAHELYGASRPSIDRWLKRYDGTKPLRIPLPKTNASAMLLTVTTLQAFLLMTRLT